MRFLLNRNKLRELAGFRGWRAVYTPLAEATGFSVSYCRRVVLGREKLTEYFMLKYIQISGLNPKKPSEWASLFDVDLDGKLPDPHSMAWNTYKLEAMGVPYKRFSPSYAFRKQDNPDVEEETTTRPTPTKRS